MERPVELVIREILSSYDTITVVGASDDPTEPAHYVPAHMQEKGWRIIPINPTTESVLGQPTFATLADVPEAIRLVNVFRRSRATPEVARQAVAAGASALWLQLGIASKETRSIAEKAGLLYVEDRCLLVEQRRLGWRAPGSEVPSGIT